jgi:hypothetical protein
VLFEARFWAGIADGSITLTFRRWKKPQAAAGRTNRTPGGVVDVLSVTVVDPAQITDAEARGSGYTTADDLRADLRGSPSDPVYRVEFRPAVAGDQRAALAASDELDDAAVAAIAARLDRLDRASPVGPWTRATLELIGQRPGVVSTDLAEALGRERFDFKLDVRKLKAMGLTESLRTGYRLSKRGEAFVARHG